MYGTTTADLERMQDNLLFDEPDRSRKLSRFWALLIAAAVIASAGVVADSTATVIGAMIVAPLMTPIMGTVLSIMTGDRPNLGRSVAMVLGGAAAAVAVGYLFGLLAPIDVDADTSTQVASRISPGLVDLAAALATGAVGAFAQCRDDVSDALPGVAIAISLVPPLTVAGLALEAGEAGQTLGALLLFATNVAAILLSGCIVMGLFGVHLLARSVDSTAFNRRNAVLIVIGLATVVAVPLAATTVESIHQAIQEAQVADVARTWAGESGWRVEAVEPREGAEVVRVAGPLPSPDPAQLRTDLDAAGLAGVEVLVLLRPEDRVELPAD